MKGLEFLNIFVLGCWKELYLFAKNARRIKMIPSKISHFDKSTKKGKTINPAPTIPKIAESVQFPLLFILCCYNFYKSHRDKLFH